MRPQIKPKEVLTMFELNIENRITGEVLTKRFHCYEDLQDYWQVVEFAVEGTDHCRIWVSDADPEPDEPTYDLDMGFDPYAGCYTEDC